MGRSEQSPVLHDSNRLRRRSLVDGNVSGREAARMVIGIGNPTPSRMSCSPGKACARQPTVGVSLGASARAVNREKISQRLQLAWYGITSSLWHPYTARSFTGLRARNRPTRNENEEGDQVACPLGRLHQEREVRGRPSSRPRWRSRSPLDVRQLVNGADAVVANSAGRPDA